MSVSQDGPTPKDRPARGFPLYLTGRQAWVVQAMCDIALAGLIGEGDYEDWEDDDTHAAFDLLGKVNQALSRAEGRAS